MHGRVPVPPAAATLGFDYYVDSDPAAGTIELAFTATRDFTTPTGQVFGGFLAAMLYDTVGPALLSTLEPDQFQSTLGLTATFLRPRVGSAPRAASCTATGISPTSKPS